MKFQRKSRAGLLLGLFLISLLFVLFWGRSTDQNGVSHASINARGILNFKMGLDIAGGVKLTYKIDYSKYREIYKDQGSFDAMKKVIEGIVLQNIDDRISKLGVSDYSAYAQNLNGEEYIVVEIGGVNDIQQAKEMIGKTVELEFKLQNKLAATPEGIAQRKDLAQRLLAQVTVGSGVFSGQVGGREGEDVFVNTFDQTEIWNLPDVYKKNQNLLDTLPLNTVYQRLIEGMYIEIPSVDAQGNPILTQLKGFSIVRLLDKKQEPRPANELNIALLQAMAEQYGLTFVEEVQPGAEPNSKPNYNSRNQTISVAFGEVFPGQAAYDIELYRIPKTSVFANTGLNAGSEDKVSLLEKQLLTRLRDGERNITLEGVQYVTGGWNTDAAIKTFVDGLDVNQEVQSIDQPGAKVVVLIANSKKADQKGISVGVLRGVKSAQSNQILKLLSEKTVYTLEDIFVRDQSSWTTAKDPKTQEILNGAYFEFARISQSQLGKPAVAIQLNDKGKKIFCSITEANVNQQMAIFVGGKLQTSPTISEKICDGTALINGEFTSEQAKELVDGLNEGAMPVTLMLAQEEKVSPLVGESALKGALIATAVSFLFVFALMAWMYGLRRGLIALAMLISFVIVLMALIKLIGYSLSLSGIAAIILSIGMGVDGCILIYEREKEERQNGKSRLSALEEGYVRSRPAIRDGNWSTGLIALLLFAIGSNIFKGFGSMMFINMLILLYYNVPVIKELMKYWDKE